MGTAIELQPNKIVKLSIYNNMRPEPSRSFLRHESSVGCDVSVGGQQYALLPPRIASENIHIFPETLALQFPYFTQCDILVVTNKMMLPITDCVGIFTVEHTYTCRDLQRFRFFLLISIKE